MDQLLKTLGIVLNATLMYTPPLLFAALGSCCSEKSGVINIVSDVERTGWICGTYPASY